MICQGGWITWKLRFRLVMVVVKDRGNKDVETSNQVVPGMDLKKSRAPFLFFRPVDVKHT